MKVWKEKPTMRFGTRLSVAALMGAAFVAVVLVGAFVVPNASFWGGAAAFAAAVGTPVVLATKLVAR